jgi:hypothetical protein
MRILYVNYAVSVFRISIVSLCILHDTGSISYSVCSVNGGMVANDKFERKGERDGRTNSVTYPVSRPKLERETPSINLDGFQWKKLLHH